MRSWLWKCRRFAERWMRRLKRRQSSNYRWSKDWRKRSISFSWSQYFNQTLSLSETWSFLIQELLYMFSTISLGSQTFGKHRAETTSSPEVRKFQSWATEMWPYEQQKESYGSRMWPSARTLPPISSHFPFSKRKISTGIQSITPYSAKATVR